MTTITVHVSPSIEPTKDHKMEIELAPFKVWRRRIKVIKEKGTSAFYSKNNHFSFFNHVLMVEDAS